MPTVSQDDVGCAQQTGGRLGYPQVAHRLQDKKNIAKFTIKKKTKLYLGYGVVTPILDHRKQDFKEGPEVEFNI